MNPQHFRQNELRGNRSGATRGNDRDALQRYSNPRIQNYYPSSNIGDPEHQAMMRFDSNPMDPVFGDSLFRSASLMPMDFGFDALHSRHNRLLGSAMSAFEAPHLLHRNLSSSMGQMSPGGTSGGFYSSQGSKFTL